MRVITSLRAAVAIAIVFAALATGSLARPIESLSSGIIATLPWVEPPSELLLFDDDHAASTPVGLVIAIWVIGAGGLLAAAARLVFARCLAERKLGWMTLIEIFFTLGLCSVSLGVFIWFLFGAAVLTGELDSRPDAELMAAVLLVLNLVWVVGLRSWRTVRQPVSVTCLGIARDAG